MLRLRPFRVPDAKTIITWQREPEEFYMWTAGIMGFFPVSEQRLLEATSARENNVSYFPMTAFDETGPVGFFTVRKPGEDDKKVSLGYVIIDPDKRGRGYGKQMLRLGLKFIFEIYGAEEASLDVFDSNPGAYNCYKAMGFRETGSQELWTAGGNTWNYIEMAISKREFEIIQQMWDSQILGKLPPL